jgi:hypothetical protein
VVNATSTFTLAIGGAVFTDYDAIVSMFDCTLTGNAAGLSGMLFTNEINSKFLHVH